MNDNTNSNGGAPAWIIIAAALAMIFLGGGKGADPTPTPKPPEPTPVVREPAAEYFRSYARIMEKVWAEAADRAEAGEFTSAKAARDWLADRSTKAREAAREPVAQAEEAAVPGSNWDGKKAAELWRSFVPQVRKAVP